MFSLELVLSHSLGSVPLLFLLLLMKMMMKMKRQGLEQDWVWGWGREQDGWSQWHCQGVSWRR